MKSITNLKDFPARRRTKVMILAVVAGVVVGALALFEKTILKAASEFFSAC